MSAESAENRHCMRWPLAERGLTWSSELAREKMWARIYLIPALQAEEDRDQVRRYLADKAREKELLGTETKVYNSDRHDLMPLISPCFWLTRRQICAADIRCDPRERAEVERENWAGVDSGHGNVHIQSVMRCFNWSASMETAHPFFASKSRQYIF